MKRQILLLSFITITQLLFSQTVPEYDMSNMTVSDTIGILYDDGGKNDLYTANRNIVFTVTSSNGSPVNVRFDEFDIETNELGSDALCIYDFLNVFDGADTNVTSIGTYCGDSNPAEFTSTAASVTFQFVSDGAAEHQGFKILWSTGDLPAFDSEYCFAAGTDTCDADRYITSVGLTDMYHQSQCIFGGYSDFTNQTATVEIGDDIIVNVGTNRFSNANNQMFGWIDWNQNKAFESGEALTFTGNSIQAVALDSGAFFGIAQVPADAVLGVTRMRLRYSFLDDGLGLLAQNNTPCGKNDLGEVEDYSILVINPDAPLPTCPTIVAPADWANNQCTNLLLEWNAVADADTFTVNLINAADNRTFNNVTDTNLLVKGLLPNTDYKWIVESINANGTSILCDTLSFSTGNLNPVATFDTDELEICANEDYTFAATVLEGDPAYNFNWSGTAAVLLNDASAEMPNLVDKTPGNYILDLVVADDRGCTSDSIQQTLTIKSVQSADNIVQLLPIACDQDPIRFIYNANFNALFQESDDDVVYTDFASNYQSGDTLLYNQPVAGVKYVRAIVSANGCSDTSDVITQERLAPLAKAEIDFFQGNVSNCEGDVVLAQAGNYDNGIVWSNGMATDTISINETTALSYTYTDANGCTTTSDVLDIEVVKLETPLVLNTTADTLEICDGTSLLLIANNNASVWNDANATANDSLMVNTEALYFANVTLNGCAFQSDSVYVKVNESPADFALQFNASQTLCDGKDSLVIAGKDGMVWSNPVGETNTTISVFEDGTYFGTITNEFGCIGYSDTVEVAFNPTPTQPNIIVSEADSTLTVEDTDAFAYIWFKDGAMVLAGEAEHTLMVTEGGDFQVIAVSAAGCMSDTSSTFNYSPTGIFENSSAINSILVYPNPTKGTMYLADLPVGNKTITVYGVNGNKVLQLNTDKSKQTLELNVPAGMYFMEVSGAFGQMRQKIIVQ